MLRLRHLLFIVGLVAVAPTLTGCMVYARPGYVGRVHHRHW